MGKARITNRERRRIRDIISQKEITDAMSQKGWEIPEQRSVEVVADRREALEIIKGLAKKFFL